MLLFWTVLLLLPVPRLTVLILVPPKPTPNKVVVLLKPARLRFLIVLLVAPLRVEVVCTQMTALAVPLFVLAMVRSRVALGAATPRRLSALNNPVNGPVNGPVAEPSMVTLSAPLSMMTAPVGL